MCCTSISRASTMAHYLNRCLFTVLALVSFAFTPAFAQQAATGTIRGRVQNASNGAYLENATLSISGTNHQTVTNSFGDYEFRNVPVGEVTLRAKYIGELDQTTTVTVAAGEVALKDFTFRETAATKRDKDGLIMLDPYVVSSERYRNAQAIATAEERNSINIKNVVSTDQFGIMPTANVGEFVKFLPGIQLDYGASNGNNQGYSENTANGVSVRGFGPEDTTILIDGMPVSSTLPGNLTRQVGLDQLSINNASRVELIKVATPDMPANSVGGQINLITRSAFEFAQPIYTARVAFNFNSLQSDVFKKTPGPVNKDTYKTTPAVDFSVSYPFSKTFGITVAGNIANEFSQSFRAQPVWNNSHATNYQNGVTTGSSPVPLINSSGTATSTANPVLTRYQITDSPSMTDRRSANIKVDWKPTANQLLRANFQYSTYETSEAQRRLDFRPTIAPGNVWDSTQSVGSTANSTTAMTVTTRDRLGDTISGQAQYDINIAGFKISAAGSHSVSTSDFEDQDRGHFSEVALNLNPGRVGLYRLDQGIPAGALTYARTTDLPLDYTQLARWVFDGTTAKSGESHNERTISLFKVDVERPIDFLPFEFLKTNSVVFKTGLRRDVDDNMKSGRGTGYRQILRSGASYTVADILDTNYVGVSPGFGLAPQQWASTYKLYEINKTNNIFYVPDFDELTQTRVENYNSYVGQQKDLKETIDGMYAQLTGQFFNNRLTIVGGMRQENKSRVGHSPFTDNKWDYVRRADGSLYTDTANPNGVQFSAGNGVVENGVLLTAPTNRPLYANTAAGTALRQALTTAGIAFPSVPYGPPTGNAVRDLKARMLNYMPFQEVNQKVDGDPSYSFNVAYRLTKNIDVKAAISRSFKLQNLESGVAGGIISGTNNFTITEYTAGEQGGQQGALGQITVANPGLKPETSNNIDLEVSYHTDNGGKYTVGYYNKRVTNQVMNFSTFSGTPAFDIVMSALSLDPAEFEDWRIVTSTNSLTEQKTSGWEFEIRQDLSMLGHWGRRFQGFISYAMTSFPTPETPAPYSLVNPNGTTTVITPTVSTVTLRANRFGGAGLQYSGNRLSVQLRAAYRNENEQGANRVTLINGNFLRRIEPAETRVDLSVSYMLSKKYSLFLSGRDIFHGERDVETRDDLGLLPSYAQLFDRKSFGVSWTFGVNGTF